MFAIIGYVIAFGCVFGVYILHGGNVDVLAKALPFEMATIGVSALGAFLVSNPPKVLKATIAAVAAAFKGGNRTKPGSWTCWPCSMTFCKKPAKRA